VAVAFTATGSRSRRMRVLAVTIAAGVAGSVLLLLVFHGDVNPTF
jgi:hypothetical protein